MKKKGVQHKLPDVQNGREACEEALGLKAPPGRAPLCKATSKISTVVLTQTVIIKTELLDQHLKTTHHLKLSFCIS